MTRSAPTHTPLEINWPDTISADVMLDGWMDKTRHLYPLVVQYEDTDAGGIVYHSNYVNFAERGRSACLRCFGVDLATWLSEHQQTFVIRRVEVDFIQPARLSDKLIVSTRMIKAGAASGLMEQIVASAETGHIFARLHVHAAWVHLEKGPVRFPSELKDIIQALRDQTTTD